ncbi:MAG: hypothetical protein ORN83_12375, partial [Chthoniobacteraceae bacterium]|nr:hypothetical protein [Chthoniobacteraceae bacterium]
MEPINTTSLGTANNVPRHRLFSWLRVWALAHNTLLELIRLKVFYFLLLFAFLVIGSSIFTVKFSFQNP